MKNKEKYAEELLNIIICDDSLAFDVDEYTAKGCYETPCVSCLFCDVCRSHEDDISDVRRKWLEEEYVEPKTEWRKVPVDTPILVRNSEEEEWKKRYFSCIVDGKVCTWRNGVTSWSASDEDDICEWNYAKLAEDIKNQEPNITKAYEHF